MICFTYLDSNILIKDLSFPTETVLNRNEFVNPF